jgi:tetratricopeptide (TPR) repeat protein
MQEVKRLRFSITGWKSDVGSRIGISAIIAAISLLAIPSAATAESSGTKNKEGNQLFAQGKYQEAEKAYLEAQANMPGRPELSYNLGNALIKQNKYDQALGALRQAVSQGNKGLQANGWYNAGNALYDMGNFRDSAQAYIQALRLNPADNDAKHNLELSLNRMQQQEKQQQQQEQDQKQNSDQQKPEGSGQSEKKNEPKPQEKQTQPSQPQDQTGQKPASPQPMSSEHSQGTFSRERALQILDALQNQELADQRRLLEQKAPKKTSVRDW